MDTNLILIVDNDAFTRDKIASCLRDLRFDVCVMGGGLEAMSYFENCNESSLPRMMIVAQKMKYMLGSELIGEIVARKPRHAERMQFFLLAELTAISPPACLRRNLVILARQADHECVAPMATALRDCDIRAALRETA